MTMTDERLEELDAVMANTTKREWSADGLRDNRTVETIDIGGNTIFTTEAGLRQLVDAINARLAELEAGA